MTQRELPVRPPGPNRIVNIPSLEALVTSLHMLSMDDLELSSLAAGQLCDLITKPPADPVINGEIDSFAGFVHDLGKSDGGRGLELDWQAKARLYQLVKGVQEELHEKGVAVQQLKTDISRRDERIESLERQLEEQSSALARVEDLAKSALVETEGAAT